MAIRKPRLLPPKQSSLTATPRQPIEVKVRLKKPHLKQRQFRDSPCKRKIVKAGRRGGKTTIAATIAVEEFLKGHRVLYAVPTSDQLIRFWIEVNLALREAIDARVYTVNETLHTIERSRLDQARIRAKTAWNADTLRGDFADVLILDEWQLMDEQAWHQVGAPMLIDNNGDAIFIYTPPSLASKSVSKAQDKKHASKLYKAAVEHMKVSAAKGEKPEWEAFHWTSLDNPHLSKEGLDQVARDMTVLAYRQEIMAEETNEAPGALWKRATIESCRVKYKPADIIRSVVGVDPPGGATECGIVAGGTALCDCKGGKRPETHGFVFEDASTAAQLGPEIWAPATIRTRELHEADMIVAEKNYGGDMVEHTIRTEDKKANVKLVQATRGKAVRAEPVAALCEKGNIHFVGSFPDLEDECCEWVPGQTGHSPNRMDAFVWVMTELMVKTDYEPLSEGTIVTSRPIPSEFRPPTSWPTTF